MDITSIIAGTGLTGGGTKGAITLEITDGGVNAAQIASNAVSASKLDTTNTGTENQILKKRSNDQMEWIDQSAGGPGDITEVIAGTGLSGGGATGAVTINIANSGVNTTQIANNAVTVDKILNSAVINNKISSNAVTTAKIADNAVTSSKIAANAIGSSEIAANAVGSSEIASGAVGNSELASDAVDAYKLTPSTGSSNDGKFLQYENNVTGRLQWADAAIGASVSWTAAAATGTSNISRSNLSVVQERAYQVGNIVFYSGVIDFSITASHFPVLYINVPTGTPAADQYGVMHGADHDVNTYFNQLFTIRTGTSGRLRIDVYPGNVDRYFARFTGWYVL